jgi:hypothetical protein
VGEEIVTTVVMKSQADRAKQQDWVRATLEKACGAAVAANVDILSLSARYAQSHANDPSRFTDSGMGELFSTLRRVAQESGVALKARTPLANLRHFLEGCQDDLQPYRSLLAGFRKPLEELRNHTDKRLGNIVHAAQRELEVFIDDDFERIEAARETGDPRVALVAFQQALHEKFRTIAERYLAEIFEDIMSGFASAVQETYEAGMFVRLPDFEQQKVIDKIPDVRPGTRKRNSVLGSLAGAVGGFIVGGPVGASIGFTLGGAAGDATGDSAGTVYYDIELTVGDNLQQIRMQALRDSQQALDARIRTGAAALWQSIELDIEQLLERLSGEVGRFETDLRQLLRVVQQQQEKT